jgi:Mn2+/Fe2+ NRAMP family transporter
MRRLLAVLLWSVIAAAFIGPGTVTTCAAAGVEHRYALLWALTFSTAATLVLQEASARLTVVSGRDLAAALRARAGGGAASVVVVLLILGAVVVGCAAYEAGNVLGAVVGAGLAVALPAPALTLAVVAAAGALLLAGSPRAVALALSGLVALMGVAFLATAALLAPPLPALFAGLAVPSLPAGSGLLVLGLIGTTVVPYNHFLGSGLARGGRLGEIRFGLAVAIVLGGVISMGIVVVGAAVEGPFAYQALAAVLAERLGPWAGDLFALGLFAAGLSSAVTAPLAAALTARGLFGGGGEAQNDARWGERGWRFRTVWIGVLAAGLGFGLSGVRPVPVILLAQALNGVLLPLVAVFLLLAVNDRRLMGEAGLNGPLSNAAAAVVVFVTLVLGLGQLARAGAAAFGLPPPGEGPLLFAAAAAATALAVPLMRRARRGRTPAGADRVQFSK